MSFFKYRNQNFSRKKIFNFEIQNGLSLTTYKTKNNWLANCVTHMVILWGEELFESNNKTAT